MLEKVKDLQLRPSKEVASLVDQMHAAGGFMGRHLAEVARIYTEMLDDRACTKFLFLFRSSGFMVNSGYSECKGGSESRRLRDSRFSVVRE